MSDRWRQRRRRNYRWLNRLDGTDEQESSLDEMFHRVLGHCSKNVKAFGCPASQLDEIPTPHQTSSQESEEREPLVDVFEDEENIIVIAGLIGIDKSNIDLHASEDKLTISVDSAGSKYRREVALPARVDVGSASSRLRNGVLEIRLKKLSQELVTR